MKEKNELLDHKTGTTIGGYEIVHITDDGGFLCHKCLQENPEWREDVVASEINDCFEGGERCGHCGRWLDPFHDEPPQSSQASRTLSFCGNCHTLALVGDETFLDYHFAEAAAQRLIDRFEKGMSELLDSNPGLSHFADTGQSQEFASRACDCCGTKLAGARHEVELVFF